MNEADTPKNGDFIEPLNFANVPQLQQASCPFDFVLPHSNRAKKQLPLLAPAQEKQDHQDASERNSVDKPNEQTEAISDSKCDRVVEIHAQQVEQPETHQDWVAEPDYKEQAVVASEFQQLLALNEELRSANNDLYEQVEELKAALAESQEALLFQKKRASVTDEMFKQQTQELLAAQEQIKSLFQQFETALATAQTQETFIEHSKAQLDINQQRLAQLERECALIQTKYNEQSHQLLQSENACRELRSRLMRQQRQTLQFKAALEKCLDTTVPSYDSLEDNDNQKDINSRQGKYSRRVSSLLANQQPIRPWSSESELFTNNIDKSPKEPSPSPLNFRQEPPTPSQSFTEESLPIFKPPIEKPEITHPNPVDTNTSPESANLKEQLDNVFQKFFTTQSDIAQPPVEKELENSGEVLESQPETIPTTSKEITEIAEITEITVIASPTPEPTSAKKEDYCPQESKLLLSSSSETILPEKQPTENSLHSSSPSPLLYPQRPPKGRKSMASVELPNFRPPIPKAEPKEQKEPKPTQEKPHEE